LEVENQQHDLQQQAQALEDLCTQLNDREHELRNWEANLQASAQDQAASRADHEIDAYPPKGSSDAGSQLSSRAPSAPQPAADDPVNDQTTDMYEEDVFARLREMSLLKDEAAAPVSALEALRSAWNLPAGPVPELESADAGAPIDTPLRDELESTACAENSENCRDSATAKFAAAAEPAAEPAAVADPAAPSPAAPSAAAAAHEEESVEVYMARLLGRLRGQSGESAPRGAGAPIAAPIRRATEGVAERDHQAAVRKSIVDPEPAHDEKKEEWTLRPRSHAPEMTSNLRAMRELANMNTKAALDLHVQKRWSAAAIGKGSVALVGLISAVLLLVWSNSWHSIPFAAGLIAMVVATFWGLQSFILANHVRIVRKADLPAATTPTTAPSQAQVHGSPIEAVEPSEAIDLSGVAAESVAAVDGSIEPA
ncbi:MAG TPA: hypothetical protein VFE24_18515, partial [Pirellulales bacterium]|nr:hypothetical protein [Pirellulales bacterium]